MLTQTVENIIIPTYITITCSNENKEVLPLDRVILIKRGEFKATILCDGKYYFPKESYNELRETIGNWR